MAGETCNEGEMVAKGKLSGLENTKVREEKTDIRNWFKKKDQFKKENIQQIKSEEDKVTGAELIDISEEDTVTGAEIIDISEEDTVTGVEIIDISVEDKSPEQK